MNGGLQVYVLVTAVVLYQVPISNKKLRHGGRRQEGAPPATYYRPELLFLAHVERNAPWRLVLRYVYMGASGVCCVLFVVSGADVQLK